VRFVNRELIHIDDVGWIDLHGLTPDEAQNSTLLQVLNDLRLSRHIFGTMAAMKDYDEESAWFHVWSIEMPDFFRSSRSDLGEHENPN